MLAGKKLHAGNLFKNLLVRGTNPQSIYTNGFYILAGINTGIFLNDIWRWLGLPGNNEKVIYADGTEASYDQDYIYQMLIGLTAIGLDFIFGLKHGAPFGIGIQIGAGWANASEKKRTISIIPY